MYVWIGLYVKNANDLHFFFFFAIAWWLTRWNGESELKKMDWGKTTGNWITEWMDLDWEVSKLDAPLPNKNTHAVVWIALRRVGIQAHDSAARG